MKHLITLLCLLLTLAAQAQPLDGDFNIGGKAVTFQDKDGEFYELVDGCSFTIQYSTYGSAGTLTRIQITDPNGDVVYNELLEDKQAVYIPKNNNPSYAIAIVDQLFVHVLAFPENGLITVQTHPYKQ